MGFLGFGKKETIVDFVNGLPASGITVMSLKALDFVVPDEWKNYTNFDEMLRAVTGEGDESFLQSVKKRAVELYEDKSQGYQSGLRLYRMVDSTDKALGAAAFADKVSEKFSLLSFMQYLTPKADTAQALDLSLKLIAELLAFTKINGIPGDSFGDFIKALGDYSGESKIRMAGLICFDGLIPLGPEFINFGADTIKKLTPSQLESNDTFSKISGDIPGGDSMSKLGFIRKGFSSATEWMSSFVIQHNLTPDKVVGSLKNYVDVSDNKLDYLAAFLDVFTNYFEHTGTQTLAVRLIQRAVNEV
ncbi:MAG: hypothetical protein BWK80_21100 [Desulfobacteraceae bacterium IS3]|nr:MAG: hypothetical protein BWK80_21100 [Desulfobacteraceae bacterium IS3]